MNVLVPWTMLVEESLKITLRLNHMRGVLQDLAPTNEEVDPATLEVWEV